MKYRLARQISPRAVTLRAAALAGVLMWVQPCAAERGPERTASQVQWMSPDRQDAAAEDQQAPPATPQSTTPPAQPGQPGPALQLRRVGARLTCEVTQTFERFAAGVGYAAADLAAAPASIIAAIEALCPLPALADRQLAHTINTRAGDVVAAMPSAEVLSELAAIAPWAALPPSAAAPRKALKPADLLPPARHLTPGDFSSISALGEGARTTADRVAQGVAASPPQSADSGLTGRQELWVEIDHARAVGMLLLGVSIGWLVNGRRWRRRGPKSGPIAPAAAAGVPAILRPEPALAATATALRLTQPAQPAPAEPVNGHGVLSLSDGSQVSYADAAVADMDLRIAHALRPEREGIVDEAAGSSSADADPGPARQAA